MMKKKEKEGYKQKKLNAKNLYKDYLKTHKKRLKKMRNFGVIVIAVAIYQKLKGKEI